MFVERVSEQRPECYYSSCMYTGGRGGWVCENGYECAWCVCVGAVQGKERPGLSLNEVSDVRRPLRLLGTTGWWQGAESPKETAGNHRPLLEPLSSKRESALPEENQVQGWSRALAELLMRNNLLVFSSSEPKSNTKNYLNIYTIKKCKFMKWKVLFNNVTLPPPRYTTALNYCKTFFFLIPFFLNGLSLPSYSMWHYKPTLDPSYCSSVSPSYLFEVPFQSSIYTAHFKPRIIPHSRNVP